MSWVPLHVHSQFSILDATASIEAIAEKAAAYGLPACALTDHGNLFGAVDFYKACKEVKVKPILGCELYVAPGSRFEKKTERGVRTSFHLTLLAKNSEGYQNLCRLSSKGFLEGFYYNPRIDHELLKEYSKGLICLSGCLSSRLAHTVLKGSPNEIVDLINWYRDIFGEDFYLELMRHPMSKQEQEEFKESWLLQQYQEFSVKQEKVNKALVMIGKELGIGLVATQDSHYMDREDWKAHEILINIQSGEPCEVWERDSQGNPKQRIPNPKRLTYASHAAWFKSPEEMGALFHDLPEALENTLKIAEKCQLELDFKSKHYPVYLPPGLEGKFTKEEQVKAVEAYIWKLCEEGIPKRYTPERLAKVKEIYPDRDPIEVVRGKAAV